MVYTVPKTIFLIPVFLIFAIITANYATPARREIERMSQVARSPVISEMTEIVSGSSTIRAFKKEV
jgi:hypothetical protein